MKGRQIQDDILLAQEVIQDVKRKVRGSNVAIKLDMRKENDSVNWLELMKVLRRFDFCEVWIDMVWRLKKLHTTLICSDKK